MDHNLKKMMFARKEARRLYNATYSDIVNYVRRELEDLDQEGPLYGHVRESLRLAYVHGHMAEIFEALLKEDEKSPEKLEDYVWQVMEKKGATSRGQSVDRRTREEERAYGNAREAWSYVLKEAGLR